MNIEIINTGSELMLGRVLNTHQQWLCRQLTDHGYIVARQVAIPDTARAIADAVREALIRAQLVIVTGGLGPTSDDLTRDAIAQLLGCRLVEDAQTLAGLAGWYAARKRIMPPAARIQARVPEGARILPNTHGTAPGLILQAHPQPGVRAGELAWLVMLPGPPRELRPMFTDQVLPWLESVCPQTVPYRCRTLRSTGVPESTAQATIAAPLAHLVAQGLEVGYCARPGEVDLRLSARGPTASELVDEAVTIVQARLGPSLFGEAEETLEAAVIRRLAELKRTVAVAESCTGGRLASRLTDVPGASAVFLGGAVTYSNALKQSLLGVQTATLEKHGAVSEATALEMAAGARTRFGADYALATTGIAGPSGGTPDKPVGTVYLGLATSERATVEAHLNCLDRDSFKQMTTQQALDLLRKELLR